MAIKYPAQSVANQIRSTALGVNGGGASGRILPAHKGVGLNQNSGGLNIHGSAHRPVMLPKPSALRPALPVSPVRPTGAVGRPRPVLLPKASAAPSTHGGFTPMPGGASGEMLRIPKMVNGGYQLVSVAASSLTPAQLAAARKNAYNGHPAAATKPGVTDAGFGGPGSAPSGLDYTGLQSYQDSMRDINDSYGAQESGLRDQLTNAPRLYSEGMADDRAAAERDQRGMVDQMSNSGLLRSGAREIADADRTKMYGDHMAQIEAQYGSAGVLKLQAALDALHGNEARDRSSSEAAAKDEWGQLYPSNPIGAPVALAPVALPKPKPSVLKPKPKIVPAKPAPVRVVAKPVVGASAKPKPIALPKPPAKPGVRKY